MSTIFLDAAAGGTQPAGANGWMTIIMLVAMLAIFYFLMYRPQKKQEQETTKMRNELAVGDEITTIGGIIGKIIQIKDETILIETSGDKTKIRLLKSAVKCVDVHAEDAQ